MSDPIQPESPAPLTGEPSPEELEAAAAASEDALSQTLAELATLKAKSAELADQYLRAQADVQNARRRAEDEIAKARKFAVESFAESLLPVTGQPGSRPGHPERHAGADPRRRRGHAAPAQERAGAQQGGRDQPRRRRKFDPHQHQAISMVPAEQEANTVVTVLQKGYRSPSACCARPWSPWRHRNKNDLKPVRLSTSY
jgi:molecular chaperone GrpE